MTTPYRSWLVRLLPCLLFVATLLSSCKAQEPGLTIQRVVDGDTFVLSDGSRVRLIGIDTPEKWESGKLQADAQRTGRDKKVIQELGEKASAFAKKNFEGKPITLKTDPLASDKDKYGRLLRYVFLQDGRCINQMLIEEGYATAYTRFPFTRMEEFVEAERKARSERQGLWSGPDFSREETDTKSKKSGNPSQGKYWINTGTNVRHNSSCPNYGTSTRGRYTEKPEGRACGQCGG